MAYSSENSCKKGCSCDSCKSSHKNIQSEAFKQKKADLVNKIKEAGKKIKNAAELGLGDTHRQDWTSTSNLSGAFPGAGTTAAAIVNIGRRVVDAFREASDPYYGTERHLQDLKDTKQEHLQNAEQASKNKNYVGAQRHRQMAHEVDQKINNHPLHPKNQQKAESMLKESKFVEGDRVVNTSEKPIQGMQPGHHYKVVDVKRTPSPVGNFVVHTLMHENGSKIKVSNLHVMPVKRVPFADKGHVNLDKRYPQNEELKTVDDVTKTLPRGVEKKGSGEAYGDVEKCAPAPKDKDKTVVAGKTGEEYSKKPQEEVKQMKEDKYARLAEAAFGPLNRSNPFRSASLNEEQETKVDGNHPVIKGLVNRINNRFSKGKGKTYYDGKTNGVHVIVHKTPEDPDTGEHHELHFAADVNKRVARHIGGWHETGDEFDTSETMDPNTKYDTPLDKPTKELVSKAAQQGAMEEEVKHIDEGDVIQFPPRKLKSKPPKVITTATRRLSPGPRPTLGNTATRPRLPRPDGPVKENLNQRFPDVERDIAAIMKESNNKRKFLEQAENIYITTPEQRQDWLEVNRGAMDVLDYINKYKV